MLDVSDSETLWDCDAVSDGVRVCDDVEVTVPVRLPLGLPVALGVCVWLVD